MSVVLASKVSRWNLLCCEYAVISGSSVDPAPGPVLVVDEDVVFDFFEPARTFDARLAFGGVFSVEIVEVAA